MPEQTETWANLRAAYRLFDQPDATFETVANEHWKLACHRPPGRYLVLADTAELDFGVHREIPDLVPTGNGGGWGIWGKVIDQIGPPDEGAEVVHVMDRGADNFEVYCHCQEQEADWVFRSFCATRPLSSQNEAHDTLARPRLKPFASSSPASASVSPTPRRGITTFPTRIS